MNWAQGHKGAKLLLSGMACWLLSSAVWGQATVVTGRVFDAESGDPLPFVHVVFTGAGTGSGTTTNLDGTYRIATQLSRPGLLSVSFLGYATQEVEVRRGVTNKIDIALEPRNVLLAAAVVRPDKDAENPAKPLMERVIEAKDRNNPDRIPGLKMRQYSRIELDINELPETNGATPPVDVQPGWSDAQDNLIGTSLTLTMTVGGSTWTIILDNPQYVAFPTQGGETNGYRTNTSKWQAIPSDSTSPLTFQMTTSN